MSLLATDPNWLLSSTAQSAAAVFAIVAGFLTTRILTLAGERRSVLAQIREQQLRLGGLRKIEGDLLSEQTDERLAVALTKLQSRLLTSDLTQPSITDLYAALGARDVPEPRVGAALNRLISAHGDARRFLDEEGATILWNSPKSTNLWLLQKGVDPATLDPFFLYYLRHYFQLIRRSRRKEEREANPASIPVDIYGADVDSSQPVDEVTTQSRLEEIDSQLVKTRAEIRVHEVSQLAMESRSRELVLAPSGWWTVMILVYFGASSVVLPLALMPASPDTFKQWLRPLVVALFTLGLVSIVIFVSFQFHELTRPPTTVDETDRT